MKHLQINSERSSFKRAWIWFWYNDVTRLLVVVFPSYFIFVIPLLQVLQVPADYFADILCTMYFVGLLWAMADNDYTNLYRIGLTPYRKKLV